MLEIFYDIFDVCYNRNCVWSKILKNRSACRFISFFPVNDNKKNKYTKNKRMLHKRILKAGFITFFAPWTPKRHKSSMDP